MKKRQLRSTAFALGFVLIALAIQLLLDAPAEKLADNWFRLRPSENSYYQNGSRSGGSYQLPAGRRYYNGRYYGNFNNRFYGPQYGYF